MVFVIPGLSVVNPGISSARILELTPLSTKGWEGSGYLSTAWCWRCMVVMACDIWCCVSCGVVDLRVARGELRGVGDPDLV
jgi:hypothetical protein